MSDIKSVLRDFDVSVAALGAERKRMSVIAQNIANAFTTRTAEGGPYVRQTVRFETVLDEAGGGVRVAGVERDQRTPFPVVSDPGHVDADAQGNVRYPNVDLIQEMVDFNIAKRSYEANLGVLRAWRSMARSAISNLST